ncbi:putative cyclin [Aspergillus clavatus NRRL 1]|uniref:RNA polymerase II holoenzyme cyclin-like subunit n=1 Tax=Aspergillus clavatus (strain ATCC 1007 / CBS 513.65 / DSM 816 / NCTC 3887 / NRRL 1 / QM 1276 / 107) TaxID=344612 RepID=A1CKA8_ASPCL|nr:cyclin [Aspergillus clavatus NRRL 1]EAW09582.1 cyclin [Aspergillus clavatus NRRL 1]
MASASTSHPPENRPVPAPSNPVLLALQAQWLFADEELTRTPSQLDGMKMEAEQISRSKGVNFITQVGIMLKLPQLTLATAAVYMHRFFMRYSMVDLPQRPGMHPYPIAATSLFLATKVEENVRRMREIVVACCRVAQKQPNLVVDEQSKEFWKWRDTILHHEDLLLEALCFDLQLEQPYRILYDFICFFGVNENKPLRNAAWAFVNDSMFTVLCLQFSPRIIAAAALYAAARHCSVGFQDDDLGRPWWEQIDVDLSEVRRACMRMAKLYENNAMQKHTQYYPTTPILSDEGTEKTRIPHAGSPANRPPAETDLNSGRKRSREPESSSETQAGPPDSQHNPPAPSNGGRSPKRPRRQLDAMQDSGGGGGSAEQPNPSASSPHSRPNVESPSSSFSPPNRHHPNGHVPPAPPGSHHRHPHPLPPAPRPFPTRDSDQRPSSGKGPSGSGGAREPDPIQQRIDEIVSQNMPPHGGPPPPPPPSVGGARIPNRRNSTDRHGPDRYRNYDDPARRRRPSFGRRSQSFEEQHPPPPPSLHHQHQHQHHPIPPPPPPPDLPQPPPPPPPPPQPDSQSSKANQDDEDGGSEEGEL